MRTCILYIATSADGYIARIDGGIDWLHGESDYGYDAFVADVDTLIMGRKTYEQVRSFGAWPYGKRDTYVYSRSRAGSSDEHATFTDADPPTLLETLRSKEGKQIWLVGGGEIARLFMQDSLIDEIRVFQSSVVLGDGLPLFPKGTREQRLQLVDCRRWDDGMAELRYLPIREDPS